MGRNQEGGVCTQKVNKFMAIVIAVSFVFLAGVCAFATDSDAAAQHDISGDKYSVEAKGELKFDIVFFETDSFESLDITYSAKLVDGNGTTQSSAVSPSSGSLANGVKETLTITAPSTQGTYYLVVEYTETIDDKEQDVVEDKQKISVVEPIKLSVDLINNGVIDFTNLLLNFYVDGVLVSDDPVSVSVTAGETVTASYNYITDYISKGTHTFKVEVDEDSIASDIISGLGKEHTFYVGESSYGIVTALMGVFAVILIIIAIYVYRKPVKNYGKPKARK